MPDVRRAASGDIPALQSFLRRAWSQAGSSALGWTGATEESIAEIASEAFLAALLGNLDVSAWIASEGDAVTGLAVVRGPKSSTRELAGIIVLESETGKGAGSALLHRVVSDEDRSGTLSLNVKTETFNERALGFYRREGFVETSRIVETVGGEQVPLVVLELPLARASRGPLR